MSQPRCLRKASATLVAKAHAAARAAAKAGAMPPTWARNATVRVHQPSRPGAIVLVRALRVWHVPPPTCEALHRDNNCDVDPSNAAPCCVAPTALLLCPYYELQACDTGAGECPSGSACPYVHADVRGAPEYQPHEKAAAGRGAYERFAPGATINVAVGGKAPVTVPSEQLLLTEAPVGIRRVVAACSHFMAKGRCDRGRGCSFAHPVLHPGTSQQQQRNAPQLQRQQQHYDQQLSPQPPPAGNASALGLENARSHDSLAAVPPASPSSSRAAVKSPSEALSRTVSSPHHGSGGDSTTPTPTSADTTNPTSAGDSAGSHPGVPSSGPRAVFFSEHRTPRDSGLVAPERRRYSHAPYDAVPILLHANAASSLRPSALADHHDSEYNDQEA